LKVKVATCQLAELANARQHDEKNLICINAEWLSVARPVSWGAVRKGLQNESGRAPMDDRERETGIHDLSVLTIFSLACTIAAASGKDGSLEGAAIAAVSLGGFLIFGWTRALRTSRVEGPPPPTSRRRLESAQCVRIATASLIFEAKAASRPVTTGAFARGLDARRRHLNGSD